MNARSTSIVLLLAAVVILLLICTLQLPGDSFLTGEIQNSAHTPVFGLLSMVFLALSRLTLGKITRGGLKDYAIAFAATVLVGAAIEFIQVFGERDADILDLVRDIAGAASFLGLWAASDRRIGFEWTKTARISVRLAAAMVLVAAFVPLALWMGAYLHRNSAFPDLLTFDSTWETKFLTTRNAEIDRVLPPDGFAQAEGHVCRLTIFPDEYCGFRLAEPCSDWTRYSHLHFDIYSDLDTAVGLAVRVDDIHHNQQYEDRYNGEFRISPGRNSVSIDLEDVEYGPSSREMDMTGIEYIYFFTYMPADTLVLYFDRLRLE